MTDLGLVTKTPYITFIYRYKTQEFDYTKELTNNSHMKLHNTISKLKHEGLGYRKISKKLNELGIKSVTGKSFYPSLVSNMWRTIIITKNKFNPSSYWKDYKHRIPIHNRIKELMDESLGYKRIHKVLVKEGFEVGKSRTTVDSIIKKIKKREEFLSQPIIDGYGNFRLQFFQ